MEIREHRVGFVGRNRDDREARLILGKTRANSDKILLVKL